jgi:hypothetical protein
MDLLSFFPFPDKRIRETVESVESPEGQIIATDIYRVYGYGNE